MTATTGTRCTLTYILYVYYIYIPSIALVRPASDLNLDEINVLSDKVNFDTYYYYSTSIRIVGKYRVAI